MIFDKLDDYFVADLLSEDVEVIFVLESPHTDEVKHGYPVAGKSGRDMSKVLFGLDEPFGRLLFENKIKNIGIVNVSNYPLQESAYLPQDILHVAKIKKFALIRQNPKLRKNDKNSINETITKMMKDFSKRLFAFRDKKIVLCGNFAQDAFDSCCNVDEFKEILRVPHPSFNNWKKTKYIDDIEKLKDFIR